MTRAETTEGSGSEAVAGEEAAAVEPRTVEPPPDPGTPASRTPDTGTADSRPPDRPDPEASVPHALVTAVTPGLVFRWAVAATVGVFVVLLASSALYAVRNVLVLVVIALFIAVSLDPAVRWLIRRGVRRSFAVTLIVIVLLGVVALFLYSVVPPLVGQAGRLTSQLPQFIGQLPEKSRTYRELSNRLHLTDKLSEYASQLPGKLGGSAVNFVRRFLGALLSGLTVLVLTIYFMADLPRLRRGFVRLFPRPHRPRIAEVLNVVVDKVGAYMIGNLIISVFAGVSSFIALELLGVPYALPLAVAVAIADLIPLVGATLGAALCVLVSLVTSALWPTTVLVLVFFIAYQQFENYLIAPRVLRNTVDMSSVAVLLAALLGGTVLGVVGALMAIPIAAAIKVLMTPTIEAMNAPPSPPPASPPANGT
jgi:predicted PurR-regulated permease PerM